MGLKFDFWVLFLLLNAHLGFVFSYQYGFLSLSCGGTRTFSDSQNITWVPDDGYVNGGNTTTMKYSKGGSQHDITVRFFPDSSARNCYKFPVSNVSSSILVRAQFVYQNYDGLARPPVFAVSLGRAMTRAINLSKADPWAEEFIWPVAEDTLPVCFHSIPNSGYPVISSLEVRPLTQGAYSGGLGGYQKFLRKVYRINCGYTNVSLRYPVDPYDRIWDADKDFSPSHLAMAFHSNSSLNMSSLLEVPPLAVLQTARFLVRKTSLSYSLPLSGLGDYYLVLYFSGVLPGSSIFNILCNGGIVQSNYSINSSSESSILYFSLERIRRLNITFQKIRFYPQVNAIEVFEIGDIPPETSSTTVSALEVIQQYTGLDLGWEDDPCFPRPWNYIACEGNLVTSLVLANISLRSISPAFGDLLNLKTLDLHNTSITGEIQNLASLVHLETLNMSFNELTSFGTDLGNLVNLQVLDLKGNKLQGTVPDNLGALKNLHLLNLENNELQGPLPRSLKRETLVIKSSGNMCLSFATSLCGGSRGTSTEVPQFTIVPERKHSGHKSMAIILGAVGGGIFLIVLVGLLGGFFTVRKNANTYTSPARAGVELRNWSSAKIFTYKEIKAATKNFKEVIGRGSFGSVYLGKLSDGKMVAVKVRFDNTQIGADSFANEVCLLSQIRHPNLVSLEGFCHDRKQQILVYEYLPGGSLSSNLYGLNSKVTLSWVRRLKIAVDAAKGLNYLHNGSEPRIIHRDVKCSNILLDARMNAKVSDFGLSKQLTRADATHVTTIVKGTAGYLDPEYYSTLQLTEKSDVYSFGVVLLELICGREPLARSGTPDTFNLVLWAKPYLQAGVFEIVDESLMGNMDMESMKKVASIASRCVERDASMRPTIAEVLNQLKDAYSIQLAYLASTGHAN